MDGNQAEVDAAVLYLDVRRSSDITLAVGRTHTVSLLSSFITVTAAATKDHDGWIGSSHGDAVLCLFTGVGRVARAIDAALAIKALVASSIRLALHNLVRETPNDSGVPLDFHIGMAVDVGPVQPATVPAGDHTAALWVGQATNTAAHLANIDKGRHSYLMVTAEAYRELDKPGREWSPERFVMAGGATRQIRSKDVG